MSLDENSSDSTITRKKSHDDSHPSPSDKTRADSASPNTLESLKQKHKLESDIERNYKNVSIQSILNSRSAHTNDSNADGDAKPKHSDGESHESHQTDKAKSKEFIVLPPITTNKGPLSPVNPLPTTHGPVSPRYQPFNTSSSSSSGHKRGVSSIDSKFSSISFSDQQHHHQHNEPYETPSKVQKTVPSLSHLPIPMAMSGKVTPSTTSSSTPSSVGQRSTFQEVPVASPIPQAYSHQQQHFQHQLHPYSYPKSSLQPPHPSGTLHQPIPSTHQPVPSTHQQSHLQDRHMPDFNYPQPIRYPTIRMTPVGNPPDPAHDTSSPSDDNNAKRGRRFRRRYNQIVRKYSCSFPGCSKSYGSLNHLNTHIVTKKHGQRKSKADFEVSEESRQHMMYHSHHPGNADYPLIATTGPTAGNYWLGPIPPPPNHQAPPPLPPSSFAPPSSSSASSSSITTAPSSSVHLPPPPGSTGTSFPPLAAPLSSTSAPPVSLLGAHQQHITDLHHPTNATAGTSQSYYPGLGPMVQQPYPGEPHQQQGPPPPQYPYPNQAYVQGLAPQDQQYHQFHQQRPHDSSQPQPHTQQPYPAYPSGGGGYMYYGPPSGAPYPPGATSPPTGNHPMWGYLPPGQPSASTDQPVLPPVQRPHPPPSQESPQQPQAPVLQPPLLDGKRENQSPDPASK